jgi:hypothetical protein
MAQLLKDLFVLLNLQLSMGHDIIHFAQVLLLINQLLFNFLHLVSDMLIEEFKGVDDICVLESDKGVLEDFEI